MLPNNCHLMRNILYLKFQKQATGIQQELPATKSYWTGFHCFCWLSFSWVLNKTLEYYDVDSLKRLPFVCMSKFEKKQRNQLSIYHQNVIEYYKLFVVYFAFFVCFSVVFFLSNCSAVLNCVKQFPKIRRILLDFVINYEVSF